MSPSLQSRSSYNWEPSYPSLPAPVLRGFPQSITRNSREWRTSLGSQQSQQISAIAATGASTTVSLLVGFSVITGPIGAAIAGAIAIAQLLVGIFQGCGQTCVEASNIANQVEPALQQNLAAYLASPVRTVSMQAAFLNNFQTAWNALTQACGNPSLQTAGKNCISDRQQGSCAYKTTPGGWTQGTDGTCTYTYPGANGSGTACWNWWIGYHDPIANDPCVVPDSAVLSSPSTSSAIGTTGSAIATASADYTPLVLIGAAGLLAWAVLS